MKVKVKVKTTKSGSLRMSLRRGAVALALVSVSLSLSIPAAPSGRAAEDAGKAATTTASASTAVSPRIRDIVFVAYNLRNYLTPVAGETEKPEEEKSAVIRLLQEARPDILGVCEIGDEVALRDLQGRLKSAGIDLPHSTLVLSATRERNLAVLSRFPIVATQHRDDLSYVIDEARLPFHRGILDATVQVNGDYQLRLIGLHLKSKRAAPEADEALMRRNEAHLVRQHVDRVFRDTPDVNLLVYGDLNDTRNETPVDAIQGKFGSRDFLADIRLTDAQGQRWTHYWDTADIYSRIDFALVSKGLSPEINREKSHILATEDWDKASDHRPLVVYLKPNDKPDEE